MRIYQAKREKLWAPVSSLPAALAGVTCVVQALGRVVGSDGRALTWLFKCTIQSTAVASAEDRINLSIRFPLFF